MNQFVATERDRLSGVSGLHLDARSIGRSIPGDMANINTLTTRLDRPHRANALESA